MSQETITTQTRIEGQMASGLRQVCVELARMEAQIVNSLHAKPTLVINAYIMTDERGVNETSIHVLLAAGFEEIGRVRYDEEARDTDRVFRLNWDKVGLSFHPIRKSKLTLIYSGE